MARNGVFTAHVTVSSRLADAGAVVSEKSEEQAQHQAQEYNGTKLKEVEKLASSPNGIRVGDRVVIRYLDDNKTATFTLSSTRDDLTGGFLATHSPLGKELIGLTEEDETEFDVDGRTRRVLVARVDRAISAL
jgi:transcription elongation GreA/GreB family factor